MAAGNAPDSCQKLSIDLKQEVSVDPRITGLGDCDELDIKYIASRETYFISFPWKITDEPERQLFTLRVDPCIWRQQVTEPCTNILWPACCGATLPFQYWNGTMKYRVQIVASAFHRGRMAIVYDPISTPNPREDNVNYTQIVDIASCRDFTVSVAPKQEITLMSHLKPGANPIADVYSFGALLPARSYGNGTLTFYVLNDLTIPNSDSTIDNDISVNVFVSAGDDFETFVPGPDFADYHIIPNSTATLPGPVQEGDAYAPQEQVLGSVNSPKPNRNLVYSGEQVMSFRMYLKRFFSLEKSCIWCYCSRCRYAVNWF